MRWRYKAGLVGVALMAVALPWAGQAQEIRVVEPWGRAAPSGLRPAAGYLTLVNDGTTDCRLVGAESPAAERVTIHETVTQDGMTRMRPAGDVIVPAGGRRSLAPGGYHLMLMDLAAPLEAGDAVSVTLNFAQVSPIEVTLPIAEAGAQAPP